MIVVSTGRNRFPSAPVGRKLWKTMRTGRSLVAAMIGPRYCGGVTAKTWLPVSVTGTCVEPSSISLTSGKCWLTLDIRGRLDLHVAADERRRAGPKRSSSGTAPSRSRRCRKPDRPAAGRGSKCPAPPAGCTCRCPDRRSPRPACRVAQPRQRVDELADPARRDVARAGVRDR